MQYVFSSSSSGCGRTQSISKRVYGPPPPPPPPSCGDCRILNPEQDPERHLIQINNDMDITAAIVGSDRLYHQYPNHFDITPIRRLSLDDETRNYIRNELGIREDLSNIDAIMVWNAYHRAREIPPSTQMLADQQCIFDHANIWPSCNQCIITSYNPLRGRCAPPPD